MTTLKEKILKEENDLNIFKKILEEIPDVELGSTQWENEMLFSASINSIATNVEFKHSCGCCSGAPLLARFYIERFGKKIYVKPIEICIGCGNEYGSGEDFKNDWKDIIFKRNKINPELLEKVQKFVDDNPAIDYSDDED
jgi:hypothetical protein